MLSRPRLLLIAGALLAATVASPGAASSAAAATSCDLDADGHDDIVAGIPGADGNDPSEEAAGAILIVPGGVDGPEAARSNRITQNAAGVPGRSEPGDGFGSSLACGDIDADGFADVIVGVPGEPVAGHAAAGAIHVFYGSIGGLDAARYERWTLRKPGLVGDAAAGARFGATLCIGDFNGDGYADVASAAPGTATVHVLSGGRRGLTARDLLLTAPALGPAGDRFAPSMAAGDVDGDGADDLVVGAPEGATGGAAVIFWSDRAGLGATETRIIDFDAAGIKGSAKPGADLGSAVATADFDGDGKDDIAIGAPGYRHQGNDAAGTVLVVFGARNRRGARDSLLSSPTPATGAAFGRALATGDLDGDGSIDLAVGVPADDGIAPYGGRAEIRYGDGNGGFDRIADIRGADLGAALGSSIHTGDANGDDRDDVWISMPHATAAGVVGAGAFLFAPGRAGTIATAHRFDRATPGIAGPPSTGEQFGWIGAATPAAPYPGTFLTLETREAWTDRDPITSRFTSHDVAEITIHHLGGATSPTGADRFRIAQDWHMNGLGWGDIAYHFIVGKDGRVYRARDPQWVGDTSTSYDPTGHLLVVVEGNFDEEHPSQSQLDALVAVVAWAADAWEVPLGAISAHRDHAATACPGANLYPFISSGELVGEVEALRSRGGVWPIPRTDG